MLIALYTLIRVLFFAFNYDYFNNLTFSGFTNILKGGLVFDLSAIIYTNILIILLSSIPLKIKYSEIYQKTTRFIFISVNTICLIINFSDIVYYNFTLRRTTATIFDEFSNDSNLFKIFYNSLFDFWPVTIAGIITIALFIYAELKINKPKHIISSNWYFYPVQTLILLLIAGLSIGAMRGGFSESTRPITLSNASKYVENNNERALVLNTPFALIRTFDKKALKKVNLVDQEELNRNYSVFHKASEPDTSLFKSKPNIVVIILESFGRGHVGYFNQDIPDFKSFTPFIDSLSQHSYVFKNAFANGRKSIDALPSIMASIPSVNEPFVLSSYSGDKINSMASILNDEGYYTAFFHGAPNGSMGFDAFTKQAGFQDYYGKDEFNDDSQFDGIWGIWDEPFFQFFANKMGEFKPPFMTTIFSVSSHHPFHVPEKYADILPEGDLPLKKCLAYTDNALRKFFENCKQQSWYNNTIFVITADHASLTNEPKYKTTSGSFAIPLLFYTPNPNTFVGFNDSINAQQIDIMPSILNKVGVKQKFVAFGSDIFDTDKKHFAFNYRNGIYQVIMNNYLLQFDGKKSTALYDLKNDELQKHNLINEQKEKAAELELHLKCIFQEYSNRLIDDQLTVNPN